MLRGYGGAVRRAGWVLWLVVAGIAGIGHLLFAAANFRFGGLAVGEGACAALAGLTLLASSAVAWRSWLRAARLVLAGTLPLALWFALTVPEHSDWVFLPQALVAPGAALLVIALAGRAPRAR